MPVYDYKCRDHGFFYHLQTLEKYDVPCPCPECGKLSSRVVRLPPHVHKMAGSERQARQTNERAQNEPLISTKDHREHDDVHRRQCGCGSERGKPKLFYTAKGEKHFPSMRPWMISH